MKRISDQHAKILHQRAIETAGALVDAEVMHENGELDDYFYTTFKRYFYVRSHLDKLTALTNIDFQVSQTDQHLKIFLLAAKRALSPTYQSSLEDLRRLMLGGAFFIYAFRFNDYQPIGVCALYHKDSKTIVTSDVVDTSKQAECTEILHQVEDILKTLQTTDKFTYF